MTMTASRRRIRSSLSISSSQPSAYFNRESSSSSTASLIERRTIQISTCLLVFTVLSTLVMVLFFMPEGTDLRDTLHLKLHRRYTKRNGDGRGNGNGDGHDNYSHHIIHKKNYEEKRHLDHDLDDIDLRHRRQRIAMAEGHTHGDGNGHEDGHGHENGHENGRERDADSNNNNDERQEGEEEIDGDNTDDDHDSGISSLFPFHKDMDESTKQELYSFVKSIRKPFYESHPSLLGKEGDIHVSMEHENKSKSNDNDNDNGNGKDKSNDQRNDKKRNMLPYDIYNCPENPPPNYPYEFPILDIIHNWNPDNTSFPSLGDRPKIYASICRFDFQKGESELQKALNYRRAELPFILRDDPSILQVVKRWNTPNYLSNLLKDNGSPRYKDEDGVSRYRTEYSESNHLMFYRESKSSSKAKLRDETLKDWVPPMSEVYLTYDEWVEKASQPLEDMGPEKPHYYFRVNAKQPHHIHNRHQRHRGEPAVNDAPEHFMFSELPFFQATKNFYIVDESQTRGINCRFGMNGNIAEAHFDGSRNFIALFGGERRYVLSHPKQCPHLGLYPSYHPSGRHSALDWSDPDLDAYPLFRNALANEVVLQAGDVLYLPTHWFHFIISLDLNWQCNARSGISDEYAHHIRQCGF